MRVLAPCMCGETPLDELDMITMRWRETSDALLNLAPYRPLYHWAPTTRRKQIIRYGLLPGRKPTTAGGLMPVVCFGDSPSWAWVLSGGQRGHAPGSWDLWETTLDRLTDPITLASADRPSGLHEVRTASRVYKRDIWYVASRTTL